MKDAMLAASLVFVASLFTLSTGCESTWDVTDVRSILVDLRDQPELDSAGQVSCAGHVPFNTPANDGRSFEERFRLAYGDGTGYDNIYLFCRSGNRAGQALAKLQAVGMSYKFGAVKNIVNLGGYTSNNDWLECSGCPEVSTEECTNEEHNMRAITSGTGTRCYSVFSNNEYYKGVTTLEECQQQCITNTELPCNYITFYPSNKRCYHTPKCDVVNCAANIWQKDTVCKKEEVAQTWAPTPAPTTPAPTTQTSKDKVQDDVVTAGRAGAGGVKNSDNVPCCHPDLEGCNMTENNGLVCMTQCGMCGEYGQPNLTKLTEEESKEERDLCTGNPFITGKIAMKKGKIRKEQTFKDAKLAVKRAKNFRKKADAATDPKKKAKFLRRVKKINNPTVKEAQLTMEQVKAAFGCAKEMRLAARAKQEEKKG